MKLRNCRKYILLIFFISCIALLSTDLKNIDSNIVEDKPMRTVDDTTEKRYVPDSEEPVNIEWYREIKYPSIHLLPAHDDSEPVVISPL